VSQPLAFTVLPSFLKSSPAVQVTRSFGLEPSAGFAKLGILGEVLWFT